MEVKIFTFKSNRQFGNGIFKRICMQNKQLINESPCILFPKSHYEPYLSPALQSGKLVMKLFDDIKKVLDYEQSHVCLLIDEVESIAFARQSVSDNEPSDSLRVVNAVLTQLDQIRHYPNLLVLTTSNMTASIDGAFMDRADIKQFIGHPSTEAIGSIFASAIHELIRANIILHPATDEVQMEQVLEIAAECQGFSGRTLRKLPFLAHALHMEESVA